MKRWFWLSLLLVLAVVALYVVVEMNWSYSTGERAGWIQKFGRKGWLPAFRDAALLKTAYAFGLRRNETRMLDVVDFGRNPEGAEFGEHGVLYVRFGKAMKGSPPKRRSR